MSVRKSQSAKIAARRSVFGRLPTLNLSSHAWMDSLESRRLFSGNPVLTVTGAPVVNEGDNYVLNLNAPSSANLTTWTIDWGDSTPAQSVAGAATSAVHQYHAGATSYHISATGTDGTNLYTANTSVGGANGSPAPGFGTNGQLTTSVVQSGSLTAVQSDGKFIVASPTATRYTFAVARFNSDGSPDTSFGIGGVATGNTSVGITGNPGPMSLTVAPDGKILVGGGTFNTPTSHLFVARFNANGTLDTGFGNFNGFYFNDVTSADLSGGVVNSIAVDTNAGPNLNKIVLGVTSGGQTGSGPLTEACVARLNADGSTDVSFGNPLSPGFASVASNPSFLLDGVTAAFILPNDKIVAAGNALGLAATLQFNSNGTLDTSYGVNGWFVSSTSLEKGFTSAALDSAGNIVGTTSYQNRWALARVSSNGTADSTFGNNGALGLATTAPTANAYASSIAIQSDGKLVVAGNGDQVNFSFVTARYNPDGTLDTSFGSGGSVISSFGGISESAAKVNILPGGKILVGGASVIGDIPVAAFAEFGVIANATPVIVTVNDVAPVISLAAIPAVSPEGTTITATALVTDPFPADLTNTWSVTKSGGGAVVASGTGKAISFKPADNGNYVLTFQSSDVFGASASASKTIAVTNVAPTLAIGGDVIGVRGQTRRVTLTAADPSSVDTAAGFTYTINWGDGTATQTALPGQALALGHAYKSNRSYTITATVADKDGGNALSTQVIAITPVALEGTTLAIGGVTKNDLLILTQSNGPGGSKILNLFDNIFQRYNINESTFTRIDVYQADDDLIFVAPNVSRAVYLVDTNGNVLELIHAAYNGN